jgi:hypothetical protein
MSYDIYLRSEPKPDCPTCKRPFNDMGGPDLPNPTYNLTPIFDLALTGEELPNRDISEAKVVLFKEPTDRPRGLRLLSGRKAADTITWIEKALGHLNDPEKQVAFKALEPSNGWGDLPGAIRVMEKLLQAAKDYPDHEWEVR